MEAGASFLKKPTGCDAHHVDFHAGCFLRGHLELTENTQNNRKDKEVVFARETSGGKESKKIGLDENKTSPNVL